MKRRFQFRLRTLFVVTTLAAVACAVVPWVRNHFSRFDPDWFAILVIFGPLITYFAFTAWLERRSE